MQEQKVGKGWVSGSDTSDPVAVAACQYHYVYPPRRSLQYLTKPRHHPPSHHMTNLKRVSASPTLTHRPSRWCNPALRSLLLQSSTVSFTPRPTPARRSPHGPYLLARQLAQSGDAETALCHAGNSSDLYCRDTMHPGKSMSPRACNKRLSIESHGRFSRREGTRTGNRWRFSSRLHLEYGRRILGTIRGIAAWREADSGFFAIGGSFCHGQLVRTVRKGPL